MDFTEHVQRSGISSADVSNTRDQTLKEQIPNEGTNLSAINIKESVKPGKGNINDPCEKNVCAQNSSSSPPVQGSPSVAQGPSIDSATWTNAPFGFRLEQHEVTM